MLTLTVYRGDRVVRKLDLDGPEIAIGRNADNTVVLADDGRGVSRAHAVLRVENDGYVLYDRDSQNGTFLEGKRIKRAVIQSGQDIVIGPYRLVPMFAEVADADPASAPTVIASRITPPQAWPASTPEATPPVMASVPEQSTPAMGSRIAEPAVPAQNTPPTGSPTAELPAEAPSEQAWMSRQPPSLLYGVGGVAVVVLAAVVIWQLWPAPTRESALVTLTTTTTTMTSVTTSIPAPPPPNPHAERIAEAESAMALAEEAFASKRYTAAAAEFDRVAASLVPGLIADPQPPQARELRERAVARATEARRLAAVSKIPPPVVKPLVDPNAVATRQGESAQDYDRRNKEAEQDYALGRRLFTKGDYIGAIKIFAGLASREPGWRDVATNLKNSQERLEADRKGSLDEAQRREAVGYSALIERRFADAATELMAASKALERALSLQTPTADKLVNENFARRRELGKLAFDSARTHANYKQINEAATLYRIVIDVLPPGDPLRLQAELDLKRIGIGRE